MRRASFLLLVILCSSALIHADDSPENIKKIVLRSTLNQPGTRPFHLKATLAPTFERDRQSNRTGEIEIWWASPVQWKREVRSPEFHQILIVNGGREWQKNDGDYFPEWLRETSVALINPVPSWDQVMEQLKGADIKKLAGNTDYSWSIMSSDGHVQMGMGAGLSITDSTGLLSYGGGLGWGGSYKDYKKFHNRVVARTVSVGSPEVTAKIVTLEDLHDASPGLFDAGAVDRDSPLLQTVVVDEIALRKNLQPGEPVVWPALKDGPLEGAVTTEIVIDRTGALREIGTIVSTNPALSDAAKKVISAMRFTPYLQNGVPVQVLSRITLPFKTIRPEGVESFDSALSYFEKGRHVSFPAAGNGPSYVLRATFHARVTGGTVEQGEYTDTWKSDSEWRREARIGKSRYVRTRDGENGYLLSEGPDAGILRFVLTAMEPIPASDTFVESDWKIKRDNVDGIKTIRVLAGYESPAGGLDPEQARAFWFDSSGKLVKTFFHGLETKRLGFSDFAGVQIARQIKVLRNGALAMVIDLIDISPSGDLSRKLFMLPGHEWKRQFTAEAR